jgi:RHS repeat-associated protein
MPLRNSGAEAYRYAFNGKEKDDEVKNVTGAQYDYGFRIYDPRLGKFLSTDPLTESFPFYTPYQFAGNKPIWAIDLDGLEEFKVVGTSDNLTIYYQYDKFVKGGNYEYVGVSGIRDGKYDKPQDGFHKKLVEGMETDNEHLKADGASISTHTAKIGPITLRKPVIKVTPASEIKGTTTAKKNPVVKANPIVKKNPVVIVNKPKAIMKGEVPSGASVGWFSVYTGAAYHKQAGFDKNMKKLANWLVDNPEFNVTIVAGGGAGSGSSSDWDSNVSWFSDMTYGERIDDMNNIRKETLKGMLRGKGIDVDKRVTFEKGKIENYPVTISVDK